MPNKKVALQAILDQSILPLFYYHDPVVCLAIVKTLYQAGVRSIEFTNRGPEALNNFKHIKKQLETGYEDLHIGVGTIKTAAEAHAFIEAGADYIVAPIVNPEVGRIAAAADLLWIPGCMTPTEISIAQQEGAALIKIFPANILGPAFISSIRELFSGQLFVPTGGVEIEFGNMQNWFKSGVCAVGLGSKLIDAEILEKANYELLSTRIKKALEIIKEIKDKTNSPS